MKNRVRVGGRLPSYEDLTNLVNHIVDENHEDESVAVAGGLAMQIWGSPRLTGDLDLIAESGLGYEGTPLSFGGVRTVESGIDLDIIIRSDEWRLLYEDALEDAVEVDGIALPVVTPEFLVPMKMVAGRKKDEGDVRYLVLLDDFDHEEAEKIVRKHLGAYAVRELRAITAEAVWRKSRGEEG